MGHQTRHRYPQCTLQKSQLRHPHIRRHFHQQKTLHHSLPLTLQNRLHHHPQQTSHHSLLSTLQNGPLSSHGTVEVLCYVRPIGRGSCITNDHHYFLFYSSLRTLLVGSADRTS